MMAYIKEGITESQTEQLVNYTNTDKEIQKYTSDLNRFKDRKTFKEWLKKKRKIYTMIDNEDNLLGIVWFGSEGLSEGEYKEKIRIKDYGVTMAIRIYGPARGKGLSHYLLERSWECFKESNEYTECSGKKLWLITSDDNEPAKKLYLKFGFREIGKSDKNGKIVMVFDDEEGLLDSV